MTNPLPTGIGWTALLVARARANESRRTDRLFDDPLAEAFVEAGGDALAVAEWSLPGGREEEVNRWRQDSVALRTWFLDDVAMDACQAGCRRVVLLAAGLDARAFRLDWPKDVRLFELDMPDVFAFKERVVREQGAKPTCERIVIPKDLREDDWPETLKLAGYEPAATSMWLVEGLLMYLTEKHRDGLMNKLSRLAVAGSRLGLDHRPGFFATPQLPGGSAGHIPAAQVDDPSLTDPSGWLAKHGWRGEVRQAAELFREHHREVPPSLEPAAPGVAQSWLANAIKL